MKGAARHWASILWPAFLMAAVLEGAVFAWVDPLSLSTPAGASLPLSASAIYSIAFLVFWACTALACALTVLLGSGTDDGNAAPVAPR